MGIRVKSRAATRFERRWWDYCWVLDHGTHPSVGATKPPPPDLRAKVQQIFAADSRDSIEKADIELNQVWERDDGIWQRRLGEPFLRQLSPKASRDFGRLVKAGCQPDRLAHRFHQAAQVSDAKDDQEQIRKDLAELESLTTAAKAAIRSLLARRTQFDEFLAEREYRVLAERDYRVLDEREDGGPVERRDRTELGAIEADFARVAGDQLDDVQRLKEQIDGRRQPLLGHAQVRLSMHIHQVTGGYQDRVVTFVLGELLKKAGTPERGSEWLKKKRARWKDRLAGRG